MSIINPYITSDTTELKDLLSTFISYIEYESTNTPGIPTIKITKEKKKKKSHYIYTINKDSFELEWNVLKQNSSYEPHRFLLQHFGEFRKIFIDSIIFIVSKKLPQCKHTKLNYNKCTAIALGSSSITSDYDINLQSDIPSANKKILEEFTSTFQKFFKKSSNKVFDTNIYGIGFLNKNNYILKIPKTNPLYSLDNTEQRIWAFSKLYYLQKRYDFPNNVFNIKGNKDTIQEFSISILKAEKLFKDYKITIDIIKETDPIENIKLYNKQLTDIQELIGTKDKTDKPYSSINKDTPFEVIAELKTNISLANVYANETYFSQGAFLHVVGELQSGLKLKISKEDYHNSCIENFCEIHKLYIRYKNSKFGSNNFLLNSYKYLYRMIDAAKKSNLYPTITNKLHPIIESLEFERKQSSPDSSTIDDLQEKFDDLIKLETPTTTDFPKISIKKRVSLPSSLPNSLLKTDKYARISTVSMKTTTQDTHTYMSSFYILFSKFFNKMDHVVTN